MTHSLAPSPTRTGSITAALGIERALVSSFGVESLIDGAEWISISVAALERDLVCRAGAAVRISYTAQQESGLSLSAWIS